MSVNAQKEISRAEKFLAKGDAAAARKIYQSILTIYPENNAARKGLGRLAPTPDAESGQRAAFDAQFSNLVLGQRAGQPDPGAGDVAFLAWIFLPYPGQAQRSD